MSRNEYSVQSMARPHPGPTAVELSAMDTSGCCRSVRRRRLPAPTGLRPKAQGCPAARANPGLEDAAPLGHNWSVLLDSTAVRPGPLPGGEAAFVLLRAPPTMSNRIHVLINGEQFGPYPEAEFRQHVADKKILKSDLVWREGLRDWIPAAELLDQPETAPSTSPPFPPTAASILDQTRAAAEQGDADAQFNLGQMLDKAEGAPLNRVEAVHWF